MNGAARTKAEHPPHRVRHGIARALATAAGVLAALGAAPRDARATDEPAPAPQVTVRALLHRRAVPSDAGAWWVDIGVHGTDAPIRLVRRVVGDCAVHDRDNPEGVFVRVGCTTRRGPVAFEVAREGDAVVVRRTAQPGEGEGEGGDGDAADTAPPVDARGGGPRAPAPMRIIARAALPPGATVRVARP